MTYTLLCRGEFELRSFPLTFHDLAKGSANKIIKFDEIKYTCIFEGGPSRPATLKTVDS